ncbi:MAG: hypothetical protein LIO68_05240 [Rikenellaceae bacterium]|nr:hypothetical protein [Rikenellaceae bacterium]
MMSQEELLGRIERLEAENRRLRERETDSVRTLHTLIRKLPAPSAAVGPGMNILLANAAFIRLGGYRAAQLAESAPALDGVPLNAILPREICTVAETVHTSGEDTEREDIVLDGVPYTLSVYNIRRGELSIVLLRNLADPDIQVEELTARLQQTADRNIRMIQQIAFLLGEEVSESAKTIGSVIRALQGSGKKEDPR